MSFEVLHDLKKLIIYMWLVGELHLHLIDQWTCKRISGHKLEINVAQQSQSLGFYKKIEGINVPDLDIVMHLRPLVLS